MSARAGLRAAAYGVLGVALLARVVRAQDIQPIPQSQASEVPLVEAAANSTESSTGTELSAKGCVSCFGDGVSTPGGAGLPNPRAISNAIFGTAAPVSDPAQPNALGLILGQFITHDIDLTHDSYPGTLKVLGDAVGGSMAYPRASVSLSQLLGHTVVARTNNALTQPIELTPN